MRKRLPLVALLLACAAPRPQPPRGAEVFRVDGDVENAPFVFGRDDLPLLERRSFESARPTATRKVERFEGAAVDAVLGEHTMAVRREADTAVVHGEGGVRVPVPLPLLRQLHPVLADHVDGEPTRSTGAGPSLLLAWPDRDHPGIETDPRLRWWWVSGVQRIELRSWIATYGRALRVPAGAPDAARHGADIIAAQCIGCHAVRGTGGARGPSLTDREGPLDRLRDHAPQLADHLRVVGRSTAAPTLTSSMAADVATFLAAVQVAGPPQPEPADDQSEVPGDPFGPSAPLPPGEPPLGPGAAPGSAPGAAPVGR